jgi:glycosyltransferase involved in cell wall biosynthesis
MMKIGYIINQEIPLNLPRGDAVHILHFIENLNRIGCEVFLIRKDRSGKEHNIKIHYIKSPIKFWKFHRIFYSIEFYYKCSSIIKKERPDILQEREVLWRTYLNFGGPLLAHKYNIPYVLEVNAPILYERGRYHSYISRELEKIFEKRLFAKVNKIIVVSNVLKSYLLTMGVSEEKIAVVPNGADEDMFNPDISGLEIRKSYQLEDKKVICYSGSLDQQWQGIGDILKSAKIINSSDPSVRFLIIGNTEGQEVMVKLAPDNVIFTGQIEHINVPAYLAAADILLAPYKLEEDFRDVGFYNSPVKLFEYMAMGKPIITSNIGQIEEIIEHGKTGLMIEPGNYNELARNILTLMEDEQLKKKLGKNARIEVEKNYTWERNARKIMTIYEEILEKRF